jgi:hypothetical protein
MADAQRLRRLAVLRPPYFLIQNLTPFSRVGVHYLLRAQIRHFSLRPPLLPMQMIVRVVHRKLV